MKRTIEYRKVALAIALALALVPGTAFASTSVLEAASTAASVEEASVQLGESISVARLAQQHRNVISKQVDEAIGVIEQVRAEAAANKLLEYDRAALAVIGTQESSGHTICCPSFSCAYADAVMDGTIHSHDYYTCSCCSWTDWGGGNSSFRYVGTDEQLLREAYDEIAAGRPTVIHVRASYGEHWIALIGFEGATDPDHLTLSNFTALDPWDGAQINAASRFVLYGDGCEHITDRRFPLP